MHISLVAVGKTVIPWVKAGLDEYCSRLGRYVSFSLVEIPDVKGAGSLPQAKIKELEGREILRRTAGSDIFLLDERGRELRSVEFASALERLLAHSSKDICFVVGGAYGFSEEVYAAAKGRFSLSKMTFNHQMVRTIFAEQLYRAFTIMGGEPYHHE